MKSLLYLVILIPLLNCSTKKSAEKVNYSKEICQCLDSLNKTMDTEHSFPICFEDAMRKDSLALTQELLKSYPDTSKGFLNNFTDELQIKASIALIDSCTTFYKFSDSSKQQQYKSLNRDSLEILLKQLVQMDTAKTAQNYYERSSTLYFQLGDYENALVMVEKLLSENPTNTAGIFIKASIMERSGKYQEAITLYNKVAELTHRNGFYIYSAIARRKKNGL